MTEVPFAIVDREDLVPRCPHCDEPLAEIYSKAKGFAVAVGRTTVYFCPHCRKVLGFAQGRMI